MKPLAIIDNTFIYRLIFEVLFFMLMAYYVFLVMQKYNFILENLPVQIYFMIILFIFIIGDIYKKFKGFRKNPPMFTITASSIEYDTFETEAEYRKVMKFEFDKVKKVSYIIISDNRMNQGYIEHKPILKKIFKTDIGDLFLEVIYYAVNIGYWITIGLPSRIARFLIKKEPLYLIWKNMLIEFDNQEALIININNAEELNAFQNILMEKDISISKMPRLTVMLHDDKHFSPSRLW